MARTLVCLLAVMSAACAPLARDAAVPQSLSDEVESARQSLAQNEDGLIRSAFSFRVARCRADGGLLVVFEQLRHTGTTFAFAMRGPTAAADSWAGGLGLAEVDSDPEILHFFSESPEVRCGS